MNSRIHLAGLKIINWISTSSYLSKHEVLRLGFGREELNGHFIGRYGGYPEMGE